MDDYSIIQARIGDGFEAVQAVPDDIPQVTELLLKTARWLQSRGSDQWSGLLRGEDSHRTSERIRQGDVFLFNRDGVPAGMVMLLRQPSAWDEELWGEGGHERAVYLHRLAIERDFAGQGLGGKILDWAGSGIRFDGKDRIRLDCIADNATLNGFYRGRGYAYRGAAVNGLGTFSKYEKAVAYPGELPR